MLRLVVVAALLGVAPSEARVVMMPSVARSCPGSPAWSTTAACLERFGNVKVVRSEASLRVVQLGGRARGELTSGIYLYVQREGRWAIGGMLVGAGQRLVGMSKPRIAGRTVYRLDVRTTEDDAMISETSSRPMHVRQQLAVFCPATSEHCVQLLTSCDAFVGGRAYWVFRGKLSITGREIRVVGDRSKAGERCSGEELAELEFDDDIQ